VDGFPGAHSGSPLTPPDLGAFSDTFPATTSLLGPSVTISTAAASGLPPGTHAGREDTIACMECGRKFSGLYRSGNLNRHRKHKHLGTTGTYNCTVPGCTAVFQRSDARLKHVRIKHPQLHLEGGQKERGIEQKYQVTDVNAKVLVAQELDYHVGQWFHVDDAWTGNSPVQAERHNRTKLGYSTCAAHCVLAILVGRLNRSEYLHVCGYFFTRWHDIVQQLLDNGSNAHSVYANVLDELGDVMRANDTTYNSYGHSSRAPRGKRAEPRSNSKSELGYHTGSAPSRTNRVAKRNERKKLIASDSDKVHRLALGEPNTVPDRRQVDCPVYKHHVMNNTTPPCRGCRVDVMSQVRSHLNPDRAARTHRGYPQFVEQCPRCKQDFVDRAVYAAHSSANTCLFQHQARGDIVIPWAKQYFALYPSAPKIPAPWTDSRDWLPDSVLEQCRAAHTNSATRNAMSEEPIISATATMSSPADQRRHSAAMDHMLHDLVSPTYLHSSSSPTPVLNPNRLPVAGLGPPSTGVPSNDAQYWQDILQNFQTLQRSMREGAAHLSPEQLRFMADESSRMLGISQNILQQHQSRATPSRMQPSADFEIPSTEVDDAVYRSPAPARQLQSRDPRPYSTPGRQWHNQLATPSTETLSSQRSQGARSSQHAYSTPISLSSEHRSTNATFLSPYSPFDSRPTSLPPDFARAVPPLSVPGPRSLPGDGCIDPALLNSPSDNNDTAYHDFAQSYADRGY
jgi:uncharacterized C2H2 Zn-finger protein